MSNVYTGSKYDSTALKKLLNQAQDAYHQLATGTKAVKVARNGREVTFTQTNMVTLHQYILELQSSLGLVDKRRSPARMSF